MAAAQAHRRSAEAAEQLDEEVAASPKGRALVRQTYVADDMLLHFDMRDFSRQFERAHNAPCLGRHVAGRGGVRR